MMLLIIVSGTAGNGVVVLELGSRLTKNALLGQHVLHTILRSVFVVPFFFGKDVYTAQRL